MSSMRPQSAVNSISAVPPLNLNNVSSVTSSHGRRSSTRPATASHTARSSVSGITDVEIDESTLHRNAVAFFDTFKNHDMKEVIAQTTASWLLSTDFRGNAGAVHGMLSDLKLSQDPFITVLMPKQEGVPELEYREVHQIIRDLTVGIFALNQLPSLILEPNFDYSTTCRLPLAYKNTLVGQTLISLDYAMKSLWHGVVVPDKKRASLAERWRSLIDMNSATGEMTRHKVAFKEFSSAGQQYITDSEHLAGIYDELNTVDPSELIKKRENSFFSSYADYVRCIMTFRTDSVKACRHVNVVDFRSSYSIEPQVLVAEDKIEAAALQKLRRRLRNQMDVIRKNIEKNLQTKHNLELMKLISFLAPLLATMRRRMMRIPDVDSMLSLISSESIHTDAELPPFAFGEDKGRPCLTFEGPGITHTHGGICFDIETENIEEFSEKHNAESIVANAAENLRQIFEENSKKSQYSIPTTIIDGGEYYVIHIPIVTYYPATPPQPGWLHALYKELSNLRPRRLPMNDMQIHELFKQTFGFKKAFASKGVDAGLKMCTCRGLIAPLIALMRKVNANALFSPDLQGLTLVHYAAIYNQPAILSILLSQRSNAVNLRRTTIRVKSEKKQESIVKLSPVEELDERTGLTPLHYAARCGSIECCTMLLACKANPILSDDHGWSVMHHAAHCGHETILRILLRRKHSLLDIPATGSDCCTPLLVAASGGSVDCVKYLIKMGAKHDAVDAFGDNAVHRSTLNFHTPVLEYFIEKMEGEVGKSLPVWDLLVGMLESGSVRRQDSSLRCLEMLLHHTPSYWKPLLFAGAVNPLVALLQSSKKLKPSSNISVIEDEPAPIRSLACAVICLMSEQDDVRRAVSAAGAITTLIALLTPIGGHSGIITCELQSRSSVVLSDLACVDDNASRIAKHGGILPLVNLLQVDVVDVLVNAVNSLCALCKSDKEGDNQRQVVECGAVAPLVELLSVREEVLSSATAAAVAEICRFNQEIQNVFLDAGVLQPLVAILRGRNFKAKVQAAKAVESLTQDNEEAQRLAAMEGTAEALCTMFQAINISVKEQGARALWALAGDQPEQQRQIAMQIGLRQIKDMLNSKSETLQLVGCQTVAATAYLRTRAQNELADYDDMISNLIRLIRLDHTTRPVIAAVIHAINSLCVGVAGLNNKNVQLKIAEAGAIELLAQRVWECSHDECLQVELLHCLACTVVGCPHNEDLLNDLNTFGFEIVLELLNSFNQKVRQRAVSTLARFSFNRIPQQKRISRLGGLSLLTFEDLLCSLDLTVRAEAAFQMVVLARIISDSTIVDISARGILVLVEFLDSFDENLLIVTAQCITSLSHTRAGVTDALVTSGVVSKLLRMLSRDNDLLRMAASQALGYLSFNRVASRELISACRSTAGLYEALVDNNGEDGKISDEFIAEYRRQCAVGLPITKTIPAVIGEPNCAITAVMKSQHQSNKNGFVTKRGKRVRSLLRSRSMSPAILVTDTQKK